MVPSLLQVNTPNSVAPATSFEAVCAVFFDLKGVHYLIVKDHLSGWIDPPTLRWVPRLRAPRG